MFALQNRKDKDSIVWKILAFDKITDDDEISSLCIFLISNLLAIK